MHSTLTLDTINIYRDIVMTPEQIALFQAVRNTGAGSENIVRAALAAFGENLQENINVKDSDGHTALHIAAAHGLPRTIEQLLDAGASVDARNNAYDVTPLHSAAAAGKVENGRVLISRGAPIEAKTTRHYSETPLHYAGYYGQDEFVKLLLESGANYKALSNRDTTPSQRAREGVKPDTARLIINYHAELKNRRLMRPQNEQPPAAPIVPHAQAEGSPISRNLIGLSVLIGALGWVLNAARHDDSDLVDVLSYIAMVIAAAIIIQQLANSTSDVKTTVTTAVRRVSDGLHEGFRRYGFLTAHAPVHGNPVTTTVRTDVQATATATAHVPVNVDVNTDINTGLSNRGCFIQ